MVIAVENVLLSNSVPWSWGAWGHWANMKIIVTHRFPEKKFTYGSHYGSHFPPLACISPPSDGYRGTVLLSSRQEMGFKFLASSDMCPNGIGLAHRNLWLGSRWQGETWGSSWCCASVETFHCSLVMWCGQHLWYYLHIMDMQMYVPLLATVRNHHPLGISKSWASWDHGCQPKGERCSSWWNTEDGLHCLWELSVTGCGSGHCWGQLQTRHTGGFLIWCYFVSCDNGSWSFCKNSNTAMLWNICLWWFSSLRFSNISSQLVSVDPEPSIASLKPLVQDLLWDHNQGSGMD